MKVVKLTRPGVYYKIHLKEDDGHISKFKGFKESISEVFKLVEEISNNYNLTAIERHDGSQWDVVDETSGDEVATIYLEER